MCSRHMSFVSYMCKYFISVRFVFLFHYQCFSQSRNFVFDEVLFSSSMDCAFGFRSKNSAQSKVTKTFLLFLI